MMSLGVVSLHTCFAVVSSTAVVYDWGEQDSTYRGNIIDVISPALTFGQEVRLMLLLEQPSHRE